MVQPIVEHPHHHQPALEYQIVEHHQVAVAAAVAASWPAYVRSVQPVKLLVTVASLQIAVSLLTVELPLRHNLVVNQRRLQLPVVHQHLLQHPRLAVTHLSYLQSCLLSRLHAAAWFRNPS